MGYIDKNYLQTQFKNFADRLSSVLMAKAEVTEVTQEEYDNLSEEEKAGNTLWAVTDGDGGSGDATAVNYDNTASGLDAANVQDAIDRINTKLNTGLDAVNSNFPNTLSNMTLEWAPNIDFDNPKDGIYYAVTTTSYTGTPPALSANGFIIISRGMSAGALYGVCIAFAFGADKMAIRRKHNSNVATEWKYVSFT